MQEVKAFNEKRAEIYWWFSSLFVKALTEEELEAYHSDEVRHFLADLGENASLKTSVDAFVDILNRLQNKEYTQHQLATDFYELFLNAETSAATPCASVYIDKSNPLQIKPAEDMKMLMTEFGVQIDHRLDEPHDHLAVELDFLANMIIRSNELEQPKHMEAAFMQQNTFIEDQLMSWLPYFAEKCQKLDGFGFYSSITQLLIEFCKLDSDYLVR